MGDRKKVNRNRKRVKMVSDAPDHLLPWVLSRWVAIGRSELPGVSVGPPGEAGVCCCIQRFNAR